MVKNRPIAEILADFKQPIDPNLISQKPVFTKGAQKGSADFVSWYDLVSELDRIALIWDWEIRTQFLPDRCVIEGRLSVHGCDRSVFREATGVELLDSNGFGDPVYSAEASALRRAMAKFGYALDLWRKDKPNTGYSQPAQTHTQSRSTYDSDPISEKQVARLYAIAKNEAGLTRDNVHQIIKEYADYNSAKDIMPVDYDGIIEKIMQSKFLTAIEARDLMNWWRTEKISDDAAKNTCKAIGFDSTAQIPRVQINAVKSAMLNCLTG